MDTTPLLPEVPGGQRQAGLRLTVLRNKVGGRPDQVVVQLLHKLQVTIALVVLPERPEDKRRAVLLEGDFVLAVELPGMPGRAPGTVRIVFMHQGRAILRQSLAAEGKKAPGDVLIAHP